MPLQRWQGPGTLGGCDASLEGNAPSHAPPTRRLEAQLAMEEERRSRWRDENVRRRTDYIPFAFQLLSALAERGQLTPLVEKAQEAHRAKQQQRQQAASAGG